jgi:hypothetical protein
MAKKTEEEVSRGVAVATHTDAMSKVTSITVSIPPYGPGPDLGAFSEVLRVSEELRLMSDARALVAEKFVDRAVVEEQAKSDPLHEAAFYLRASRGLQRIDELISGVPPDYRSNIEDALSAAIRVGCDLTTARLRHIHLADVAREVEAMKPARKRGGVGKRGQFKEGTHELLKFMDKKMSEGKTRSHAAELARRQGLGTSKKANEALYCYHRPKK